MITEPPGTARYETWTMECVDEDGAEWEVMSSLTHPVGEPHPMATTGVRYTSSEGAVAFALTDGAVPFRRGDTFSFTTTGVTALSRGVTIQNGQIREMLGDWNHDGKVDIWIALNATRKLTKAQRDLGHLMADDLA